MGEGRGRVPKRGKTVSHSARELGVQPPGTQRATPPPSQAFETGGVAAHVAFCTSCRMIRPQAPVPSTVPLPRLWNALPFSAAPTPPHHLALGLRQAPLPRVTAPSLMPATPAPRGSQRENYKLRIRCQGRPRQSYKDSPSFRMKGQLLSRTSKGFYGQVRIFFNSLQEHPSGSRQALFCVYAILSAP